MNIQPRLEALDLQENAARTLTDDLRTKAEELQARLREAETHVEHLAITRKTVTALADRIPTQVTVPDLPEHPDYLRILAVFNEATNPLRARDVCEALDHELLPKPTEQYGRHPWLRLASEQMSRRRLRSLKYACLVCRELHTLAGGLPSGRPGRARARTAAR